MNPDEEAVEERPAKKLKLASQSVRSRYLLKQNCSQVSGNGNSKSNNKSVQWQLQRYLEYDHGDLNVTSEGEIEEINLFKFWNTVSSELPALAKLARLVLTAPASSAPVERVFSHGGLIFKPNRRSLSDSNLCQLIYLKVNRLKDNISVD